MRRQTIPRLLLFWLTCLAFPLTIFAERLPIRIFTSADGLGSSFVDYVMRDSRGFMWFCTRDGLSRFDGSRFVTYHIGSGTGTAPPGIEGVYEARGYYWVATTGGLYRFRASDSPQPDSTSDEQLVLNAEFISEARGVLHEDRTGTLWFVSDRLYVVKDENNKVTFHEVDLKLPQRRQDDLHISEILEGADGNIWMNSSRGPLRRLPHGRFVLYEHSMADVPRRASLALDSEGRVWYARDHDVFVFRPEPGELFPQASDGLVRPLKSSRLIEVSERQDLPMPAQAGEVIQLSLKTLINDAVERMFQTQDGHIWHTSNGRLLNFDGRTIRVYTTAHGLPPSMNWMEEDLAGNLWISGNSGLVRLNRHGLISFGESDGLRPGALQAINEGGDGTLYFSGTNFSLSRFDGKRFEFVRPAIDSQARSLWASRNALLSRADEWWFLTRTQIYRFAPAKDFAGLGRQTPMATYDRSSGLIADGGFQVFEDRKGDIWLSLRREGSVEGGLARWVRAENRFQTFSEAEGLPDGTAPMSFAEDNAGNLWLGLYRGGLVRYAEGRFTEFTDKNGAPDGSITDLHLDQTGRLWISSSISGASRIDNPTSTRPDFFSYTTQNGLATNNVRTITEDRLGNIYLGTARGIDRVSADLQRIRHYSLKDGLTSDFVVDSHRDRAGELWFATVNGLSKLVPSPEEKSSRPTIWLGGLRLAGEVQPISFLGTSELKVPDLSHTRNNLQIEFFGLDFSAGETLRYQFMLEGADSGWSTPSEQRGVTYANLKPGAYRFMVRAVNADGLTSDKPAVITFTILTPIWLRWWFVSLAILLLLALLYALYHYRLARLREVNAALSEAKRAEENLGRAREERLLELERVRKRIASDLHDDIGSSLTQISLLSEVVNQRIDRSDATVTQPLSMIANSSRELVDSMSDIVWAINPQKDHLSDLTQRMRTLISELLTFSNIKFSFRTPVVDFDLPLGANLRREVFLIFKESVNNIVKHSGATEAEVEFRVDHHQLFLQVADNGVGFDPERENEGHGLLSMRTRAEGIGSNFEIVSVGGKGTTVTLSARLEETAKEVQLATTNSRSA